MRIIRGNNDHNDENHDPHDHEPARSGRSATEAELARQVESLIDGAEALLAAAVEAVPFEPELEPTTVARLVKSVTTPATPPVPVEDENLPPALRPQPEPAPAAGRRAPRWVRTALPGSLVVVTVATAATLGQPAVVAIPIDVYAGCWIGFLFWNAAHRPPLREVTTTAVAAALGLIPAVLGVLLAGIRALLDRADHSRRRTEATRTTL